MAIIKTHHQCTKFQNDKQDFNTYSLLDLQSYANYSLLETRYKEETVGVHWYCSEHGFLNLSLKIKYHWCFHDWKAHLVAFSETHFHKKKNRCHFKNEYKPDLKVLYPSQNLFEKKWKMICYS